MCSHVHMHILSIDNGFQETEASRFLSDNLKIILNISSLSIRQESSFFSSIPILFVYSFFVTSTLNNSSLFYIHIKGKPGKVKWRKESDTYLTIVCRHRWSRQIMMKVDKLLELTAHLSAPAMSTDNSQVGVALFPSF